MKRLLRIFRKILLTIIFFIALIMAGLLIFYATENRRLERNTGKLLKNNHTRVIHSDTTDITARLPLELIPVPQKVMMMDGYYQMPEKPYYSAHDSLKEYIDNQLEIFPGLNITGTEKQGDIVISYVNDLPSEGYRMEILPRRIEIEFSDKKGLYYAFISLKVLKQNHNGRLPCVMIEDYPDLPVRGIMIDISRDKVPSTETLLQIAQLAADLKYNHFQLYVEGFSYGYQSFRHLWEATETPVTEEDIRKLDYFCRTHFIDMVPNQNSLGHMAAWLATEEYSGLAECPDGYKLFGILDMKTTLDPSDPRSINLVERMMDDMLPAFSSVSFNANLDEPFELGKGKSKKLVKEEGLVNVYLDYTLKVHDLLKQRNRKMLMWGDIILRHPESIKKLPGDITLLDWGYESGYPFEKNCKIMAKSDVQFMLCPGTSSWTSITGRTNNMLGNIASAASNAVKYDAEGLLLTDWGDMGHWQYLPVSYAGYVTGGALSWNSRSIKKLPLTMFLSKYVFRDSRHIMGQLALDLGRYMQFEEIAIPNMTTSMLALQFGLNDRVMYQALYEKVGKGLSEMMSDFAPEMLEVYMEQKSMQQPFDFDGLFEFLNEKQELLNNVMLTTPDGEIIRDEFQNAIRLLRTSAELQYFIAKRPQMSAENCVIQLKSIESHLDNYLRENHRLWMARNKKGGYERSTVALNNLLIQVKTEIANYQKPGIYRALHRIKTMVITSAAVLYLKVS